MRHHTDSRNGLLVATSAWLIWFQVVALAVTIRADEPVEPVSFEHAGIIRAWKTYRFRLTFGNGQTLALVDDGCKLSIPVASPGSKTTAIHGAIGRNTC